MKESPSCARGTAGSLCVRIVHCVGLGQEYRREVRCACLADSKMRVASWASGPSVATTPSGLRSDRPTVCTKVVSVFVMRKSHDP